MGMNLVEQCCSYLKWSRVYIEEVMVLEASSSRPNQLGGRVLVDPA
jgi:hypothetical protein